MGKNGYQYIIEVMKWFAGNTLTLEADAESIRKVIAIKIGTDKRTIRKYFADMALYGFITLKDEQKQIYRLNHRTWLKTVMEDLQDTVQEEDLTKTIKKLQASKLI